jgi:hypothetical protein
MTYSLRAVVPDGALRGPRWLLHLVKVATSMTIAFALIACGADPLWSGLLASFGLMAGIVAKQWPHIRTQPWHLVAVDKLHDFALASVALACTLRLAYGWIPALSTFAVCVALWWTLHPRAVP